MSDGTLVAGIDTGVSGAVALLDLTTSRVISLRDMPYFKINKSGKNRSELDPHALVDMLDQERIAHAYIEQTHAMPENGRVAIFSQGYSLGCVVTACAALKIPYTMVHPQTWKRRLQVPASKDGARLRASQLLPSGAGMWTRQKDHGRAEAACIAAYGLRMLAATSGAEPVAVGDHFRLTP